MFHGFMTYPESCERCRFGGPCEDCSGTGDEPSSKQQSQEDCHTCGGTGAAPPMFPNCPEDGCS